MLQRRVQLLFSPPQSSESTRSIPNLRLQPVNIGQTWHVRHCTVLHEGCHRSVAQANQWPLLSDVAANVAHGCSAAKISLNRVAAAPFSFVCLQACPAQGSHCPRAAAADFSRAAVDPHGRVRNRDTPDSRPSAAIGHRAAES
jgi:hypothetical protein